MSSKAISEFLGVSDTPPVHLPVVQLDQTTISDDAIDARGNLRALMATATEALTNALNVAIQSESPRAFEVVANLIATTAELNTKLLETHNTELKVKGSVAAPNSNTQNNTTTNNVVFQGTPAELSKLLKTL